MSKWKRYLYLAAFLAGSQLYIGGAIDTPTRVSDVAETSGNPIIRHIRSADPAAEVWNDGQVWIYASHDQDDAVDYSTIDGYHVFSSYDLVHWTDHGEILHSRDVSWGVSGGGWMFAPDAAYRNGTYYLYFPHLTNVGWRIGVATSPVPEGPFTDIGHYIEGTDNIDPTCFMDDDGQAYLLWGGGSESPKIARLMENMTELAEEPRVIEYGADNFGEGGYMHKRNGIYYFSYTCNTCWPYQGFYATGDNPYGPFVYKGELNPNPPGAQDHHSIIEYHGQWYYFYHVGNYEGGSLYRRNICIDSLYYKGNGIMKVVKQTVTGVGMDLIGATSGKIVPGRFEAEDYFRSEGISNLSMGDTAVMVAQIEDGDWFEYVLDILGSETYTVRLGVSAAVPGTKVILMVDEVVSDSVIVETDTSLVTTPLFLYKGKHTLEFQFSYPDPAAELMKVDWIELAGNTEYFSIESSVKGGGSIQPEGGISFKPDGITYYVSGDTAEFRPEADFNCILDSVWIDGVLQPLSDSYLFQDISENHTIKASFSECASIPSTPYYQINNEVPVQGTEVVITEENNLRLWVDHDTSSMLSWTGPHGFNSTDSVLVLDSIRVYQQGNYTALLVNSQGCVSEEALQVSVAYMELDVYEAEQFFSQTGVMLEPCTDLGGGKYVGYIENNDFCYYTIAIHEPGYYEITARVATASNGGNLEVRNRDSLIATIPVNGDFSDGWEEWYTTEPVEAGFEEGEQVLKFTFTGGEGYLFNFNWFDLEFSRGFDPDTTTGTGTQVAVQTFPNPFVTSTHIVFTLEETSVVDLQIFSGNGALVRPLVSSGQLSPGRHTFTWNGEDGSGIPLKAGVYFIRLQCNRNIIHKKVVMVSGN